MKNFDSRTYSINDFLDWHEKGSLSSLRNFSEGLYGRIELDLILWILLSGENLFQKYLSDRK
jgi:hypothetical protein